MPAAVVVLACAAYVPGLRPDSRVEAFITPGHPALAQREEVLARFGMGTPMVILVANDGPDGIFTPHTLDLVGKLTDLAQRSPGIEPGGVTSLATLKVVENGADGMKPVPVVDADLAPNEKTARARQRVHAHAVLRGSLVAEDDRSTLIIVERFDGSIGPDVYRNLLELADTADTSGGERLYVTGHGALTATLGEYIDSDTHVLYAIVTVVIAIVLAAAFRTFYGVALPLVLIGATLAVCLGSMGMSGAPFTVISSALPVVISSLVVTDGLHILSLYHQHQHERPQASTRELVVAAMTDIWRPCVGARVTDIAGFVGLYLGSGMPPMKSFGLFGSVAIVAEMALALVAYPCLIVLAAPGPSPALTGGQAARSVVAVRRLLERASEQVLGHTRAILFGAAAIVVAGVTGIGQMVVNDSWVGNFDQTAPVRIATEALASRHGIRADLDLVVDSGTPEGMPEPALLERLETLRQRLEVLPGVTRVRSIADDLREIALATGGEAGGALPDSRNLAAQYLLIADSEQTRRWLDEEQRRALVRVQTRAHDYLAEKTLLGQVQPILDELFPSGLPTVAVGGMVAVGYAWVSSVGSFHVLSTLLSVGFCWLQMSAGFRSWAMGSLAIVPMTAAMLLMYAVMGWCNIPLGIGTSMFAALAIGTGVDFAIHTIDRFMVLRERGEISLKAAVAEILPTTGRTILYSAAAIILGFAVLCFSKIPAVRSLGVLVTVAVTASLVATLSLLPALISVLRPKQLVGEAE